MEERFTDIKKDRNWVVIYRYKERQKLGERFTENEQLYRKKWCVCARSKIIRVKIKANNYFVFKNTHKERQRNLERKDERKKEKETVDIHTDALKL